MKVRPKNKALIYIRRSGNQQETSLGTQLTWAIDMAKKKALSIDARLDYLPHMQKQKLHAYRSIRLDDAISGSELNRPGLNSLIKDVQRDKSLSHVVVYKRDRLGRPESPLDMMVIEENVLRNGVTFVRSDGEAVPSDDGMTRTTEQFRMLLEYHASGDFLKQHSERIIRTQLRLARDGYWSGGIPPYGFIRALVNAEGTIIEELPKGKHVRQSGCHVVIIPKNEEEIRVWVYILHSKEKGWGYKRIANHLNQLKVPSPAAGTYRTDQGIRHQVSGLWTHTTVRALCKNRAIIGLLDYGRRSEGKHRRVGEDGPRTLNDEDRHDENRTKRIFNAPSIVVTAKLPDEPQFDQSRWERIQAETDKRGRSQEGIPRTRDPARYPLSCRLIDLSDDCGSLMYAKTSGKRRLYTCGRYMQTSGSECENNSVDAEAMLAFVLGVLNETTHRLGAYEQLRTELLERATSDEPNPDTLQLEIRNRMHAQVEDLERQLGAAQRNLAIEEDDELRGAIRAEYGRIKKELKAAQIDLDQIPEPTAVHQNAEEEVDAALSLLDDIRYIYEDPAARADILPLLQKLGLRVGLRFAEGIKGKKRKVRQLAGGIVTFGDRLLPNYDRRRSGQDDGQRGSRTTQNTKESNAREQSRSKDSRSEAGAQCSQKCQREGISFTKGSREFRGPVELFVSSVASWEPHIVRLVLAA